MASLGYEGVHVYKGWGFLWSRLQDIYRRWAPRCRQAGARTIARTNCVEFLLTHAHELRCARACISPVVITMRAIIGLSYIFKRNFAVRRRGHAPVGYRIVRMFQPMPPGRGPLPNNTGTGPSHWGQGGVEGDCPDFQRYYGKVEKEGGECREV